MTGRVAARAPRRPGGRGAHVVAVLVAAVAVLVVGLGALVPTAVPASAQGDGPPSTPQVPTGDIIPDPDSGRPPEESGDRGGTAQLLVLAAIVVGVVVIVVALVHQSRQTRRPPPLDEGR